MCNYLHSLKKIEHQYSTGEEPVLVECSDRCTRICKYSRYSGSANKLLCELVGSILAAEWDIHAPAYAFVKIRPCDVPNNLSPDLFAIPCFGNEYIENTVDITPSSFTQVQPTKEALLQLLKIALFDFWVANEDRNANNANLLYDLNHQCLVPIDNGNIFNSATWSSGLSQLTCTDTILYGELFRRLSKGSGENVVELAQQMRLYYDTCIAHSKGAMAHIIEKIPPEWITHTAAVENKLQELFEEEWIECVWTNFIENVKDNLIA